MFSTGPMFISAQYGLYVASHPHVKPPEVRVLPKSLYGKNAKEGEAPHSFFVHFYGSSWHADDAAFVGFLAHWGKGLMWLGLVVLVIGALRLAFSGTKQRPYSLRRIGGYDVLLPRWTQRQGRWILDLGWFTIPGNSSQLPSPVDHPGSRIHEDDDGISYLPFDTTRVSSPAGSDISQTLLHSAVTPPHPLVDAMRRARNRFVVSVGGTPERPDVPRTPTRHRRFSSARGVLFFLPAFWTQSQDIELASTHRHARPTHSDSQFHHPVSRTSQLPPEKQRYAADLERAGLLGDAYTAEFWDDRGDSNRPPAPAPPVRDLIDTIDPRVLASTARSS
jgi:inositol phosphorylceramide mannosyltransferase catalytic subunit